MRDMHGPPVSEYICPGPAILVPSYGSNSFPVLWRFWRQKICVDEHESNEKQSSKGWKTPTENHWFSDRFQGVILRTSNAINFTREQNDGRSIDTIQDTEGMMCVFLTPIGDALRPKTTRRKTAFL